MEGEAHSTTVIWLWRHGSVPRKPIFIKCKIRSCCKRGCLSCLNHLGLFPLVVFGIASTCQTLNHQELRKVCGRGRAAEPQPLPPYRTFWNCLFLPVNPPYCDPWAGVWLETLAPEAALQLLPFSCQLSPADSGSENQTETAVPCAGPERSFLVSSPDIGETTTVSVTTAFGALWGNLFNDLEFLHRKNRAASFGQKLFSCCVLPFVSLHPLFSQHVPLSLYGIPSRDPLYTVPLPHYFPLQHSALKGPNSYTLSPPPHSECSLLIWKVGLVLSPSQSQIQGYSHLLSLKGLLRDPEATESWDRSKQQWQKPDVTSDLTLENKLFLFN